VRWNRHLHASLATVSVANVARKPERAHNPVQTAHTRREQQSGCLTRRRLRRRRRRSHPRCYSGCGKRPYPKTNPGSLPRPRPEYPQRMQEKTPKSPQQPTYHAYRALFSHFPARQPTYHAYRALFSHFPAPAFLPRTPGQPPMAKHFVDLASSLPYANAGP
jgi:hypothetical protein